MPPIIFSAFVVFGFQQAKPAYNGTWILNSEKSRTAISQGLVPIRGRITITVTDKEMIIINQTLPKDDEVKLSPQQLAETKTVCSFGPVPAENTRPMRPILCAAKWQGDALVTTQTPKQHASLVSNSSPRMTTFSVTGAELKSVATGLHPNGKDNLTATLFYDRAR